MIYEGVIFVKRCPSCGKWMVWDFLTGDAPHEWWCQPCGHREPGDVDESRLDGDMPVHGAIRVNREENNGQPLHPYRNVEIIE